MLPSPRMSSPLPSFTTPQTQGLGQEDHYLQVVTEQISTALASDPELPGPEATQAPGRVRLHLLHLREVLLRLGQAYVTTPTRMTHLVSPLSLRRLSLPRRRIPPLHLNRIRYLFGACCQRGR
jgi:hypothetical protein